MATKLRKYVCYGCGWSEPPCFHSRYDDDAPGVPERCLYSSSGDGNCRWTVMRDVEFLYISSEARCEDCGTALYVDKNHKFFCPTCDFVNPIRAKLDEGEIQALNEMLESQRNMDLRGL